MCHGMLTRFELHPLVYENTSASRCFTSLQLCNSSTQVSGVAFQAMELQKITTYKVKFGGGKYFWDVKEDDLVDIGGEQFVKLPRMGVCSGFTRLILEEDGVDSVDKKFSLVQAIGYEQIQKMRNEIQSKSLVDCENPNIPDMFKAVAKAKRLRLTQTQRRDLKNHPDVLMVQVQADPMFDLRVKQLVIPFDMSDITNVIRYIRAEGFDLTLKRSAELPKGIHRKKGKYPFQYTFTDDEGRVSRHYAQTLEGAVEGTKHGPLREDEATEAGAEDAVGVSDDALGAVGADVDGDADIVNEPIG
jgi:hypothetical protein